MAAFKAVWVPAENACGGRLFHSLWERSKPTCICTQLTACLVALLKLLTQQSSLLWKQRETDRSKCLLRTCCCIQCRSVHSAFLSRGAIPIALHKFLQFLLSSRHSIFWVVLMILLVYCLGVWLSVGSLDLLFEVFKVRVIDKSDSTKVMEQSSYWRRKTVRDKMKHSNSSFWWLYHLGYFLKIKLLIEFTQFMQIFGWWEGGVGVGNLLHSFTVGFIGGHHRWLHNEVHPFFSISLRPVGLSKLQAYLFPDVFFPPFFLFEMNCLLPPFTVLWKIVLARPDERETLPYHCSLRLFTIVRRSSCGPISCQQASRWNMAATIRAFDAEYYLRRSDWLKLLGWLATRS